MSEPKHGDWFQTEMDKAMKEPDLYLRARRIMLILKDAIVEINKLGANQRPEGKGAVVSRKEALEILFDDHRELPERCMAPVYLVEQ